MKIIQRAILFIVVTIALLEVALRIIAIFPHESATFVSDEHIGFRMRPNISIGGGNITNSSGFNDYEHPLKKNNKKMTLAIIGDSFVFGVVPRDENFTQILQKEFYRNELSIEVINMGIPAAGPENYLGLLRNDASRFNADMVYVVFFIGNDIVQSHPDFTTKILFGSTGVTLVSPYLIGLDKGYLYTYRMARAGERIIFERFFTKKKVGASFSARTYFSIEQQRSIVYEKNMSRYLEECYIGSIRFLSFLFETANSQGMKLKVILAPDEIQVDKKLRAAVLNEYRMNQDNYDYKQPQKIISKKLSEIGISYIDLLPAFEEAGKTTILYKKYDSHWNEAGNKLAADIIAKSEMNRREK